MQSVTRDNPDLSRRELLVEQDVIGFVNYRLSDQQISLDHTEVDPNHRSEGVGSTLVRSALDEARQRGLPVIPVCPFVADYIKNHSEYADLVPRERRQEFGIAT